MVVVPPTTTANEKEIVPMMMRTEIVIVTIKTIIIIEIDATRKEETTIRTIATQKEIENLFDMTYPNIVTHVALAIMNHHNLTEKSKATKIKQPSKKCWEDQQIFAKYALEKEEQ